MTGICIPTSADIRIEVAGRRVAVSGCEWERLTERAEVGSSVLEEAVVLAAVRGEYEQQEG